MVRKFHEYFKKIYGFLGSRVALYVALGCLAGFGLFLIEFLFAYSLQMFLSSLGLIDPSSLSLPSWMQTDSLEVALLIIFLVGSSRAGLQWLSTYWGAASGESLKHKLRSRLIRWAFHSESLSSGQFVTLFNERTNCASAVIQLLQGLSISITTGFFLMASLIWLAPIITLSVLALFALFAFPLKRAENKIRETGKVIASEWERANRRMLMNIRNLLLVQIYGTQEREENHAQTSHQIVKEHSLSFQRWSGLMGTAPQIVGLVLICIITIMAKKYDALSSGVILTYFYLFVRFVQNLSRIAIEGSQVVHLFPHLQSIAYWWADHSHDGIRSKENRNGESKEEILPFSSPIGWKLENVSFRFQDSDREIIQPLNLEIPPGNSLLIMGPSGCGKTTLTNLLIGNLRPSQGTIDLFFQGDNALSLQEGRRKLLKSIGYVGPESFLIEGTVRENLGYGLHQSPSDQEITVAIEQAECHFIFEKELKLDYRITEQGHGLSAGQKQRLCLARALLRKPRALFLDEPTANLDEETEWKLLQTLKKLKGSTTIVAVSHHRVFIEISDQVLNLGRGR